jgi:hypothetical protein
MVRPFDDSIINPLKEKLKNIENILDADILTFHRQIVDGLETGVASKFVTIFLPKVKYKIYQLIKFFTSKEDTP